MKPKTQTQRTGEFVHKESHKHRLAKELLAKWLRDEEVKSGDFCKFFNLSWRTNWGVHVELPFYETSDPYYFENSKGIIYSGCQEHAKKAYLDNNYDQFFESNVDRGRLLFVPDITIFHKGDVSYMIEVVHTNPVNERKLNTIKKWIYDKGACAKLFEISAENILRQCGEPTSLIFNKII